MSRILEMADVFETYFQEEVTDKNPYIRNLFPRALPPSHDVHYPECKSRQTDYWVFYWCTCREIANPFFGPVSIIVKTEWKR